MDYHLSVVKFPAQMSSATYHHGDLRRALLAEAAAVLDASGVGALSLRDVARRAGVSPTAPYHHFRSKADLVCALAEDALAALDAALAAADATASDPAERIRAQGVAYVLFAVDHPERFRVAFRSDPGTAPAHAVDERGALPEDAVAFRHLVRAVRALTSDPARQGALAVAAWSLVHGLASLLVDGPLRAVAGDRARVRALAEAAVSQILLGGD